MILYFGLVLLALLLLTVYLHKRYVSYLNKYLKSIPGPKPNPFFGNMLDFAIPTHKFLDLLVNYLNTYGKITLIYDGPKSSLLLVSDEKFMEYILSSTELIEKSNHYHYFYNWLGTGLLISSGAKWKKRRRMITPSFHFSILENFVETFESTGDIFIKKLEMHEGKKFVNIYPMVSLYTLDVICEAAMGISVNAQTEDSKYVRSVKEMCRILTDRNFSPLDEKVYPFTLNYFKENRAVKIMHEHTYAVINDRINKLKESSDARVDNDFGIKKKMAFLDLLLKSTCDGKPLSKVDIREEVDTFMFEGHDTTSSAISFALYSLANNPHVQQKVLEEQKEIFNNLTTAKPTITDLHNMKYLELVIKETLRLYPSVPFYGRTASKDFEYDGVTYPKGLQIALVAFATQRDPNYYPNPLEFIPERFMEIDGKNPYRYVPFSAGPRNCIGQKFAMLEMKSILSKVVRKFELLPAFPNPELQLAPEVILISKNGIPLQFKKRG